MGNMRLGDDSASLRYYWQCSCRVFAHGPSSCAGSTEAYSCPDLFTGGTDSSTMRKPS